MPKQVIPRIRLYPMGMNYFTHRNPWVPVWLSVALPGFGHFFMGQNAKGAILMSWEIIVNHQAHLNMGIYYTLIGRPDLAQEIVRNEWLVIYPIFYAFAMYDSYRTCLELNRIATMERLQKRREFHHINVSFMGTTHLMRRNPTMAAFWSVAVPGLGQVFTNRGLKAVTLMGWYFAVVLQSGLAHATYHTLLGEIDEAIRVIDFQWLLFFPSIYVFGIVDAYCDTVEQNRIAFDAFRHRMWKFLRNGRE
ncbi:MAG TPA: hypothetical protein VD969_01100 [Symbiobacteriaceae bacterium]|nr:hypothetical protein [Symbiobacteriaceae bacterium]